MIVSPKKPTVQVKFRWDPDLKRELESIAERTGRTANETSELLIRWAIERAKQELDMADTVTPERRKK